MGNLSEELMAELNCETAFKIPIFGGIPVAESVVVTWIIMAVLIVAAFFLGRNLKVENVGKRQLVVETVIGGLHNFFYDMLGEKGKRYIPYMMTVGIYIAISNMIGLFGLKSPTKECRCNRSVGTDEYYSCRICRNTSERCKGIFEKLCRADNNNASYEHIGSVYQTTVVVYAFIW